MIRLTDILCEGCWEGYKQVGMKEKDGRMVPNCVPVEELYHRPESDVTSDDEINEGEFCNECLIEVLEGLHENQLGEAEYRALPI